MVTGVFPPPLFAVKDSEHQPPLCPHPHPTKDLLSSPPSSSQHLDPSLSSPFTTTTHTTRALHPRPSSHHQSPHSTPNKSTTTITTCTRASKPLGPRIHNSNGIISTNPRTSLLLLLSLLPCLPLPRHAPIPTVSILQFRITLLINTNTHHRTSVTNNINSTPQLLSSFIILNKNLRTGATL